MLGAIKGGISALRMAPKIANNIKKTFAGPDTLINPNKKTDPFSIFNIKGETPIRKNMEKNTRRVTLHGGKIVDVPLQHLELKTDRAHPIYRIKNNPYIRDKYYKNPMREEQVTELVDKPFLKQLVKEYGDQKFMGEPIHRLKDKTVTKALNLHRKRVSELTGLKMNTLSSKSSIQTKLKEVAPDLVRPRGTEHATLSRGKIKKIMTLKEFLESTDPKTKRPLWETVQHNQLAEDPRFKGIRTLKTGSVKSDVEADAAAIYDLRSKWGDVEKGGYLPKINKYGKKPGYKTRYITFEPTGLTKRALRLFSYQKGAGQKQKDLIASKAKRSEFMINFVLGKLSPRQRKTAMESYVNKKQSFLNALHEAAMRDESVSDELKTPQAISTWYRNLRHFAAEERIKELRALRKKTGEGSTERSKIDFELGEWHDDMVKLGLQSKVDGVTYGKWYDTKRGILKPLIKDLEREYPLKQMKFYGEKYKRLGEAKGGLINEHLTDTSDDMTFPLLDPEESINRQKFAVGGFARLFGTLSKVPKAVARVGDMVKQTGKAEKATDVTVAQAVEDKPAMFLETVRALEDAPDAKLTPNEWLSYVKQKGVSNVELDEFGLEPLLNNMMKPQKGSASFKKAENNLKTVQEEGQNITRNFSDLMKTHRGDKTHPDVIAATEALQAHKLKVKQASDVLAKLKSEQRAATPLLSKTELLETYNKEMPKIDMDIAMAEPVSRGAKDITKMLTGIREKGRDTQGYDNLKVLSNDPRLLTALHQPPQDATGMKIRENIINVMRGSNKTIGTGEDANIIPLLKSQYSGQKVELHTGQHFSELWQGAFPKIYHGTNEIVKRDHMNVLKNLVPAEDVTNLAAAKNIPEEEAFKQLYQALNIFDRQVMTADVPIPFWTKKMLYRLGDMSEGRGFFFKSKRTPAHEGTQFIPGGSGYGELKFYFNFDYNAVRSAEKTYKSGHFSGEVFKGGPTTAGTGNSPFGWGRFSERIDESGRKILLMEEIQSDLHQQVAQKGYKYAPRLDKGNVLAEMGDFAAQLDKKMQTLESTRLRKENIMNLSRVEREAPENVAELKNIEKAMKKLVTDVKKLKTKVEEQKKLTGKTGQVHPDAPFKKSENYAKVFMQGLMKMAADKGYDGIALSTGKMKKAHGNIPGGGDKWYDEIGVKAMKRIAKKSGFNFKDTTIVDGNGFTWEKIPLIEMRDINTGQRIPGQSTIPVYSKGGFVKQNMVRGYNNGY